MAIRLIPNLTESNSGYYAGFISSSFMAGRTVTSYHWGKFSDKYGRKSSLIICMFWSSFLSVGFGMATSFPIAIGFRFFMGFVNNVPTVIKCTISEMSRGDQEWEQNTMGIVFGMWGFGFLCGPTIGGKLLLSFRVLMMVSI